MSCERILVAGAGGQGIVFLGKLIANSALETVPHVTFFPSYGAEVRGGSSHCQVILSREEIPSPVADRFETMLIMNQESLTRFLPQWVKTGLAVINSSLCTAAEPARNRLLVPATQTADELGDPRVANLVLLGVLLSRRALVAPARIERALRDIWGDNKVTLERNLAAFHAGLAKD
jgi:2-oxoglutarate ferredoxin oxidoreductase subunit gamma